MYTSPPRWKPSAATQMVPQDTSRNNYQPETYSPAPMDLPQNTEPQQTYNGDPGQNAGQPVSRQDNLPAAPSGKTGETNFISLKICKVNGKDKVIDFNSYLSEANVNDFAMVHGCGGKNHARNSTIGVKICDYTKGTGENASVTVKYGIDVESIPILLEAAMKARMGDLIHQMSGSNAGCSEQIRQVIARVQQWASIPMADDGTRPIHRFELGNLVGSLQRIADTSAAPASSAPLFVYSREKVNPYENRDGLSPVSKILIQYAPFRQNGEPSKYPWHVSINNFDAPVTVQKNGATVYDGQKASKKKNASINLSADDFCEALIAVERHIRLWEINRTVPVMEEAYRSLEAQRQNKDNMPNAANM